MKKNVMDTLRERGFIKQTVFEEDLYNSSAAKAFHFISGSTPLRTACTWGTFCN